MKKYKVQVVVVEPGQDYKPGKILAARTVISVNGNKRDAVTLMKVTAKAAKDSIQRAVLAIGKDV